MNDRLAEEILQRLKTVDELYHRLVLLVAPSGAGKTAVLKTVAKQVGGRLVNVNLEVSRGMLDLTEKQRALQVPRLLQEAIDSEDSVVLLDNNELLFNADLKQDPLRLFQAIARNHTVVVAWNGSVERGYLTYATPEHPEYRKYQTKELVLVRPEPST